MCFSLQQLNDSSVIISMLESYLIDRDANNLSQLLTYYPGIIAENDAGKKVLTFPSKYNIVHPEGHGLDKKSLKHDKYVFIKLQFFLWMRLSLSK